MLAPIGNRKGAPVKHIFSALLVMIMSVSTAAASYAEDRAEIEDLMARYLFALDWNDFDAYADMFTEDAEIEFSSGLTKGRDNIVAAVKAFKGRIGTIYKDENGDPAILRHVVAHKVIRVEGDRAFATSFWYEMANDGPGGQPQIGTFGHYEDELVRVDGRWLFSRRSIRNEFLEGRESGPVNPVRAMDEKADAAKKN
jgi:uncharacterized protein (TIGR02246 family)